MRVINWPNLHFQDSDLKELTRRLTGSPSLRQVRQMLVEVILSAFPWDGRTDLAPVFDPSQEYAVGDWVAIPIHDPQELRPDAWRVEPVAAVDIVENPVQGVFQLVTLGQGRSTRSYAAGLASARPLALDFPPVDESGYHYLATYFADEYAALLDAQVTRWIQEGQIPGRIVEQRLILTLDGDALLPDERQLIQAQLDALSPERPWLMLLDVLPHLPRLVNQPAATVRALLTDALTQAGAVSLGQDRWTTPRCLEALNRPIDRTIAAPRVRSRLAQELGLPVQTVPASDLGIVPAQLASEWGEDAVSPPPAGNWQPPAGPVKLPTLSYLHLTQGYFPLRRIDAAFDPALEQQLVTLQINATELHFLVCRSEGVLKAVDRGCFYDAFLDEGIPAGTFLWLEYRAPGVYRLSPRLLPEERPVSCKLAHKTDNRLVIETFEIPMRFEGDAHVFKSELRFDDLTALFAEAEQVDLSILDLTILTVQQLTAGNVPAHRNDIFNAVFLQRMCAFNTVASTLSNQPCFVHHGGGNYTFDPRRGLRVTAQDVVPGPLRPPMVAEPVEPQPTVERMRSGQLVMPDLLGVEPLLSAPPPDQLGAPPPVTPDQTPAVEAPIPDSEVEPLPPFPVVERMHSGQLVAADLLPTPPLLDQQPASVLPEVPAVSLPEPPAQTPQPAARRTYTRHPAPPKGDDMQTAKPLFARHFLETRLPGMPEWQDPVIDVLSKLRPLFQRAQQYGDVWNEAQTEQELIKPLLNILGWSFAVQVKAGRDGRITRPDYALFADDAVKNEAYRHQGIDEAFYARALAIAEAKHWGRPLSEKDGSGRATWKAESNPSHQMVSYLVGTRVPWGILTNGHIWRLYSREVSSTASEYYEVDLSLIFDFILSDSQPTQAQLDDFKRWYLFFRRAAFTPGAGGKSFLQRVHEGSNTYAREISDKLKELVFKEVMPQIAGGFVAYRHTRLKIETETPETLDQIYRASLSLLYKLLFLLYAEARALLPMDNEAYREGSLTALAQWAADQIDAARALSSAAHATPRYDALLALFRRVDQGDPDLGIPHYNGGLFSENSPENQFLTHHKLSDRSLAHSVDLLVRDAGQPVDYAYISVRNLGAIYEGLLENKLHVLDAAAGQVELVNDKGERKATGSYYTPDYIVEYIVQHTLDPVLDARLQDYDRAMTRVTDLRQKLLTTADSAANRRLQADLADAERAARESFLSIRVLDPAMGSGHFLVNAVDHLTDGIIQRMQAWHDAHPESKWDWDPIQTLIEQVRRQILSEMERQGLSVDLRRLDDTALLTRLVMKRCIYGVDLNPMAVELAKVGLWLHSFTVGAPLSFLDHHLRRGNSLVGVWDIEKVILPGTERWNAISRTLASMVQVSEMTDSTLGEVAESSRLYRESRTWIQPTLERLNVELATYFVDWGKTPKTATQVAQLAYQDDETRQANPGLNEKYSQAQDIAANQRFFHWKLEFPEVFIDIQNQTWSQNGGFDAVIGNPPYSAEIPTELREYISIAFKVTGQGYKNLAMHFIELARDICKGGFGFIVPKSITYSAGWQPVVDLVMPNLVRVTDVSRAWKEVLLEMVILVADFCQKTDHMITGSFDLEQFEVDKKRLGKFKAIITSVTEKDMLVGEVAWNRSQAMGEIVTNYRGLGWQSLCKNDGTIPCIRGDAISRFVISPNSFLPSNLLQQDQYLSRLSRYQTPRVLVQNVVAHIANPVDHILVTAGLSKENYIPLDTVNNLEIKPNSQWVPLALLGIVNSLFFSWYTYRFVYNKAIRTMHFDDEYTAKIPLPRISFETSQDQRPKLVNDGKRLIEPVISGENSSDISLFSWVKDRLTSVSNGSDQSDVVHDLLAYLVEQMLELHKIRQAEMGGFVNWLEREIGVPLDDLNGKTTLQNYLGDYQKGEPERSLDEILVVLRRNQRKLKTDVSARAFQERLAAEYQASLARLLPIKTRLAATDRLIDQIVYTLYGLTAEEIAIVEGKP